MSPVQFLAAVVVSYLGLLAGYCLASLTKEELPTAKKIFPLLQRLSILAIAAVAMDAFNTGAATKIIVYLALLIAVLFRLLLPVLYGALGLLVAAIAADQNALLMVASLVFLCGLVSGSMEFAAKARRKADAIPQALQLLLSNAAYVAAAVISFLVLRR